MLYRGSLSGIALRSKCLRPIYYMVRCDLVPSSPCAQSWTWFYCARVTRSPANSFKEALITHFNGWKERPSFSRALHLRNACVAHYDGCYAAWRVGMAQLVNSRSIRAWRLLYAVLGRVCFNWFFEWWINHHLESKNLLSAYSSRCESDWVNGKWRLNRTLEEDWSSCRVGQSGNSQKSTHFPL